MKYDRMVLSLILGGFSLALPCAGQPLVYETSLARAITRAKYEGKLVLLDAGRPACSDCIAMKVNFDTTSPPVRQWLKASCVIYDCNIDISTDWEPYAGTGGFALPLTVFIDPNAPGTTYASYTGLIIPASAFLLDVTIRAKRNLPLVVTNVPGNPLTNSSDANYTVAGLARTNAVLSGAISNSPINAIMWRLNGSGAFQTATGTANWSQLVTLPPGTNTFESYVQYAAGKSWTNRAYLVYLGPAGSKSSQTITFNPLSPKTYGDAAFALTATASSGLPVSYTSGNTSVATISGATVTIVGSGSSLITASQAGNATFSNAPPVSQTLTVNKAALTVTASNRTKTYGQTVTFAGTEFTPSGLVNSDTVTSVTLNSAGAAAAATVAGYAIVPSSAVGAGLGNYTINYANGTLTVNKAVLTVTANNTNRLYGASNPAFTASYSGFVNGQTTAVLSGSPSLTTTATPSFPVGTYPITAALGTLSAANYSFTFVSGTLTVSSTAISITISPTNQIVSPGGNASFRAIATGGSGSRSYQWQKDGTNLTSAVSTNLTINGVSFASAGSYRCVVTDGSVTNSAAAGLWVMSSSPNIYFGVGVYGPVDQQCHLEYATNLAGPGTIWTPLTNSSVTLSRSGQVIVDEESPNLPMRFYRLVVP